MVGGAGNDFIQAGSGNATIYGGPGDDTLYAGPGNNVLVGGPGNNMLSAGTGNDLLVGGGQLDSSGQLVTLGPDQSGSTVQLNVSAFSAMLIAVGTDGLTPTTVTGSVNGLPGDGNNVLHAGRGTDWLFAGGGQDSLYCGTGNAYLDGGAGADSLYGGSSLPSGSGKDILHGGMGSDLLLAGSKPATVAYGDAGNDILYAGHVGQTLYGGQGSDALYAFAPSTTYQNTVNAVGNTMYGGDGPNNVSSGDSDTLYGNLGIDTLFGGGGNDLLYGDYLSGPNYLLNSAAATTGSADSLFGGVGSDTLFGGGGNNVLWGGAGNDWLEGQDGLDSLHGGTGGDTLVLDVNSGYSTHANSSHGSSNEVINGGGGNFPGDASTDTLTDILLVQGDQGPAGLSNNDTIRFSEPAYGTLGVNYDGTAITFTWRNLTSGPSYGNPLFQQLRVLAGAGDDHVSFAQGNDQDAIDYSKLLSTGDWVSWLDGGPGNDTLEGTPGPDQIFGGDGNDLIYGYGGNDRLWGDQQLDTGGTGNDTLYGGAGDDDMIGGGGNNVLSAWSISPYDGTTFTGVYVDGQGGFHHDNGGGQYQLENTGYDRMLGGIGNVSFYGGTGLDFMDANGGNPTYYKQDGTAFGGDLAAQDDAQLRAYAQSTQSIWYVPGTSGEDNINIFYAQLQDQYGSPYGPYRNIVQVNSTLKIHCDYSNWTSTVSGANLTVTVSASGGEFTLSYNGISTGPLAYNTLAADVQTALEQLPGIGAGNIGVTGMSDVQAGQTVTIYTITFQGTLGGLNPASITASGAALTGTISNVQRLYPEPLAARGPVRRHFHRRAGRK